ncbi:GNAT family N-acetyltransferase [Parvularcula maris]|uniref:GNAT family N-acetyltransferase n=1 Tax=Parvularcula maris TaxID=2965077 RepID=A0A9X2L681_9PROT|nr:GNAT family N-acetyltransferase [Parvularcula maris]MCQ8183801.1 GNAT family N-acetyltransferase [Parvularcula maris]
MVRLRPTDPGRDAAALFAVFGDDSACRYLPDPAVKSEAELEAKLAAWVKEAPDTDWVVTEGEDGAALGRVTIYPDELGIWQIGVMTCPAAQGRGFAGEALRQAVDHVDRVHAPRRMEADIDPDNLPSRRLFERHGFTLEGVLRKRWHTHIGVRDTALYALVEGDERPWRRSP